MKEFIEKLIGRLEELKQIERKRSCDCDEEGYGDAEQIYDDGRSQGRYEQTNKIIEIVNQIAEEYNNGWILCSKELPPQPEENPLFDNRTLELYLVSDSISDYPYRAFWNGKYWTDGFSDIEVIAWQPLPAPYKL